MCHVCALQELSPGGERREVGGWAEESRNSPLCVGFLAQRGVTGCDGGAHQFLRSDWLNDLDTPMFIEFLQRER